MATPNKFSNPDTPCCDCPLGYLHCFVTGPLFSVLCFPCVCVLAWDRERKKRRAHLVPYEGHAPTGGGGTGGAPGGGGGEVVREAPAAEPPMVDAALPRDQWPAEVRNRDALGAAAGGPGGEKREGTPAGGA